MLAPLLMFGMTNNPKSASQRPATVYVNGRDLTPNIDLTTLSYEQTGSHETGQASFEVHDVTGGGLTYPELTDGAPVRIYDARLDAEAWSGFVITRATTIVGAGTIVKVTAVDTSVLLDRSLILSDSGGPLGAGTDMMRLAYLMAYYGGRLNPDTSRYAVRATGITDAQVLTTTSLRMAVEAVAALAYGTLGITAASAGGPTMDYYIDPIGRLVYFAGALASGAPGQLVVNGLPPADGSTYVTNLLATAANYWKCFETSGTTLTDSVGGATMTTTFGALIGSVVGPIPKLSPNLGLTFGWVTGNAGVAATVSAVTAVTDNFAFEFWVSLLPQQNTGTAQLFYNGTLTTNGWGIQIANLATSNVAPYALTVNYDGVGSWSTGLTINDQAWHHVVVEKRSGVSTPFLDGVPGVTSTLVPIAPSGTTKLGASGSSAAAFAHIAVYHN